MFFSRQGGRFFRKPRNKMADESEERTMELTIEALTGTVYDLCVSPYETILGIKMKVQRLEGEKSSLLIDVW